MYDLVIRGATVIDGLGTAPLKADVAVKDGLVAAIGAITESATRTIDGSGLTLAPGIVDIHTHYDAQVTWDPTMSPSPSLGVTTAVMGNCGFGIAPSPPQSRELIVKNLSVVEGMDLDALLTGIKWNFETFGEYMSALRERSPYLNVGVLSGHSVIRTTVMGDEASTRSVATTAEMAAMKALVADAMANGAIGFGSSYSLNHSGFGGVPMPSTITDIAEFDELVGAMGSANNGVVQLASGPTTVADLEPVAAKHKRAIFKTTGAAMYNEEAPERGIGIFEDCAAAHARGNAVFVQIPCQPLSFDFTMANAYPFFSHDGMSEVKAFTPAELKVAFKDSAFRDRFRNSLSRPRPGHIFQGNWDRVVVAIATKDSNAHLIGRRVSDIAAEAGRDPFDFMLDLSLEEDLQTTFIGHFLNVGDKGVAQLLKHDAGVVALSDAGAHLIFMCDAGFGLHFLAHWVRELGEFSLQEGIRRLTSHPADMYGIPNRGRIAIGAHADLMLFDPATVGVTAASRVADLPGGGQRTIRGSTGVHGVFVNGVEVFDGTNYVAMDKGPGQVLDRFNASSGLQCATTP
ncbi:MAG: N-acyl-D-amino-acid deacylase [Gammaproteobacteria bacterium]|jgi:N-acyl-D-amino-acid deacylase